MDHTGVVASMVQQFNLRITRSASQISSSPEISSPMDVRHTAGQKPGGPALQKILASNAQSKLVESQHLARSGSQVSTTSEEVKETCAATAATPQEKRFSGSGNTCVVCTIS